MPSKFVRLYSKPKGVSNRNAAMDWLLSNANEEGVMYFADDDNTYDVNLFKEAPTIY